MSPFQRALKHELFMLEIESAMMQKEYLDPWFGSHDNAKFRRRVLAKIEEECRGI